MAIWPRRMEQRWRQVDDLAKALALILNRNVVDFRHGGNGITPEGKESSTIILRPENGAGRTGTNGELRDELWQALCQVISIFNSTSEMTGAGE